jgi:hypothetical protein
MPWHEQEGPADRTPPHCTRCDDSGRVFSDPDGDWRDCPGCKPAVCRPGAARPSAPHGTGRELAPSPGP